MIQLWVRIIVSTVLALSLLTSCGGGERDAGQRPPDIVLEINPSSALIELGERVELTAVVSGHGSNQVTWEASGGILVGEGASVFFSSDDLGEYEVIATSTVNSSVSSTAKVTVGPRSPQVVSIDILSSPLTLLEGETAQLEVRIATVGGASEDVTWATSDPTVAAVSNTGVLSALSEGRVDISVVSVFDSAFKDSVEVTVSRPTPAVHSVEIIGEDQVLRPGMTTLLGAVVEVTGTAGATVAWWSSDTSVLVVNESGLVEAISEGVAYIRATSQFDESVSGEFEIEVSEQQTFSATIRPPFVGYLDESFLVTVWISDWLGHDGAGISVTPYFPDGNATYNQFLGVSCHFNFGLDALGCTTWVYPGEAGFVRAGYVLRREGEARQIVTTQLDVRVRPEAP